MDDQITPSEPNTDASTASPADSAPAAVEPDSGQITGSDTANMPPEAPESPTDVSTIALVEDQNQGVNQPESDTPEQSNPAPISETTPEPTETVPNAPVEDQSKPVIEESPVKPEASPTTEQVQSIPVESAPASLSAPTPPTPTAPQTQPSAQQNQTSFIRALLAKANAKLGLNRQKKLDKVMQLAQKKGFITNEQAQELLHCSDATATRYLSKLDHQGRLNRTDGSHWVKYIFVR